MTDNTEEAYDKAIGVKDWLKALGISRNTFKQLLREGKIPQPLPFGERCQRWPYSDLLDVLARRSSNTLAA